MTDLSSPQGQHRHRPRHCHLAPASHQHARHTSPAKEHLEVRLCSWNLVSTTRDGHPISVTLLISPSTCVISILRLVYIYPLTVSPDFTWQSPLPAIWSCTEANTAIICSCIPTLKALVQRFFPELLGSVRQLPTTTPVEVSDGPVSTLDSMGKSKARSSAAGTVEYYRGRRHPSFYGWFANRRSVGGSDDGIVELASMPGETCISQEEEWDAHQH
jgi:hypothetical protein